MAVSRSDSLPLLCSDDITPQISLCLPFNHTSDDIASGRDAEHSLEKLRYRFPRFLHWKIIYETQ
jgi:hypothetical protein